MTHARVTKKIAPAFSLDVDLPLAGITALFGPSGSGKTLLLETIAGFVAPDAGRILLDDVILFDAESRVNVPPRRRNGQAWPAYVRPRWDAWRRMPHAALWQPSDRESRLTPSSWWPAPPGMMPRCR